MATFSIPSQIFTTALWSQIMAPCQISTFSDLFYIFKNFGNKKVDFCGGSTQLFCILPLWFFLHMASTCEEEHKRDFLYLFSPLIYVAIVQIWITGIKRQENVVNPLNIANEPRKIPNLHSYVFMVYAEHRKKIICKHGTMPSFSLFWH